jgi:hypothetical protein
MEIDSRFMNGVLAYGLCNRSASTGCTRLEPELKASMFEILRQLLLAILRHVLLSG